MKSSSRPWQVRPLTPNEIPDDLLIYLDFNDQILIPQADKKNRLFVAARCQNCDLYYYRRVSDLRDYLRSGVEIIWLCKDCRKGSKWQTASGYIMMYMPEHPNARANGVLPEHTFVMSETIGRALAKDENVHHKNGDRADNRPENLELWSKAQPAGQRIEDKVRWAIELKDQYPSVWTKVRKQMLKESNEISDS